MNHLCMNEAPNTYWRKNQYWVCSCGAHYQSDTADCRWLEVPESEKRSPMRLVADIVSPYRYSEPTDAQVNAWDLLLRAAIWAERNGFPG